MGIIPPVRYELASGLGAVDTRVRFKARIGEIPAVLPGGQAARRSPTGFPPSWINSIRKEVHGK